MDSIRTGNTVVPALRGGRDGFDYFAMEPEVADLFNQTMTTFAHMTVTTVVASYDFRAYRTIVDVGGGQGSADLVDQRRQLRNQRRRARVAHCNARSALLQKARRRKAALAQTNHQHSLVVQFHLRSILYLVPCLSFNVVNTIPTGLAVIITTVAAECRP